MFYQAESELGILSLMEFWLNWAQYHLLLALISPPIIAPSPFPELRLKIIVDSLF